MGSKICPICDGKVNSINFCKTCKRFVTPIETSHTFYLNERREPEDYQREYQYSGDVSDYSADKPEVEDAEKVSAQVDEFIKVLSRKEIIRKSIDTYGYILLADNMADAVEAANAIASEHLEIVTANPFDVMTRIKNAGAIFIGEYSSEPLGDYFAGPNHVLPTNGTAKFFSPLSVDDFIKKSSIIYYSREALEEVHEDIESFAKSEQLTAHANSIAVRFE